MNSNITKNTITKNTFFVEDLHSPKDNRFLHNNSLFEDKLGNALTILDAGIWEYDPIINKVLFTRSYASLIGVNYTKLKDMDGFSFLSSYVHKDDLKTAIDSFTLLNQKQEGKIEFTLRVNNDLGQEKHIHHIIKLTTKNHKGVGTYYSGIARDISETVALSNNYTLTQNQLNTIQLKYTERIKEQELLYTLFEIFNKHKNIHIVLGLIAKAIPNGCQFSDKISARINYKDNVYTSDLFFETKTELKSTFTTLSNYTGKIEVFYDLPENQTELGPACLEAHNLINALSFMLKAWLDKRETEKELENMLVDLENKIEVRTLELTNANKKLSEAHKDINDSIRYAKNIQSAMLRPKEYFKNYFEEILLFYKPKDIVSGDFYWIHKQDNKTFIVSADCTGHGVPGALMSMIGMQLLNFIVIDKKIQEPRLILHEIDASINNIFNQNENKMRDGMAISLCVIDHKTNKLTFSGAQNDGYIFREQSYTTLKANNFPIGGGDLGTEKVFSETEYSLMPGDTLYLFTDGLPDQFGGLKGKKLMKKNLLQFLLSLQHQPMKSQNESVENFFENWIGDNFQVDDVTLLGIKF